VSRASSSSSPIAAKAPRLRAAVCTCSGPSSSSQFGEAFCGCFLRNPAKEIKPLRPPVAGELGDLEFEIDCGRGVGAFAHSNQVAASAEEGNAGLQNRDILGMIVAELAPQLIESFGQRHFELGEADARPRRHNPCERSVRRAHKPPARRFRWLRRENGPQHHGSCRSNDGGDGGVDETHRA